MYKRVLIVDAEYQGWEALKGWLQIAGYRVEHAADRWQAIQMMRDGRFVVALIAVDPPPVDDVPLSVWHLARLSEVLNPGISIVFVAKTHIAELQALQMEQLRETVLQLRVPDNSSEERR